MYVHINIYVYVYTIQIICPLDSVYTTYMRGPDIVFCKESVKYTLYIYVYTIRPSIGMFDTHTHTHIECVLIISIVDRRQTFNAARCPLALYARTVHSAHTLMACNECEQALLNMP